MYTLEDVGVGGMVGMVRSGRCQIHLNRIYLDSSHNLKSGRAECAGSNPLAQHSFRSGPGKIVVKGAECFVET